MAPDWELEQRSILILLAAKLNCALLARQSAKLLTGVVEGVKGTRLLSCLACVAIVQFRLHSVP
ncbi:hypothetical protein STEG23_026837, partial [Scotinomys teguina]